jgi:hypothetical protein
MTTSSCLAELMFLVLFFKIKKNKSLTINSTSELVFFFFFLKNITLPSSHECLLGRLIFYMMNK